LGLQQLLGKHLLLLLLMLVGDPDLLVQLQKLHAHEAHVPSLCRQLLLHLRQLVQGLLNDAMEGLGLLHLTRLLRLLALGVVDDDVLVQGLDQTPQLHHGSLLLGNASNELVALAKHRSRHNSTSRGHVHSGSNRRGCP
jgi:hypothetical protein